MLLQLFKVLGPVFPILPNTVTYLLVSQLPCFGRAPPQFLFATFQRSAIVVCHNQTISYISSRFNNLNVMYYCWQM